MSPLVTVAYPTTAPPAFTIAKANRSLVNAFGLSFANVGMNGHWAPFSWAS